MSSSGGADSSTDSSRAAIEGAQRAFASLADFADDAKLSQLVAVQQSVLRRFQDIKGQLGSFDKDTIKQVDDACKEIARNCELLMLIKTDLDSIFNRVRALKRRLKEKLRREHGPAEQQHAGAAGQGAHDEPPTA